MATKFLGTDAWKRIKVLNKRPGPRLVAVAYPPRRMTLASCVGAQWELRPYITRKEGEAAILWYDQVLAK